MTGFVEVLLTAATLQLLVLPGEKVQFIIAGLSTRYRPLVVVGAAGSAFALWTAVEIVVGEALKTALPPRWLDLVTAGLFVAFAVVLLWSAPTEGGTLSDAVDADAVAAVADRTVFGREIPDWAGHALPIFGLMAAGEFGDKTQLVTISLAVQYGANPAIWLGEMVVIIPVSLLNAYAFHRVAGLVDARRAHLGAALVLVLFAADALLSAAVGVSVWETVMSAVGRLV